MEAIQENTETGGETGLEDFKARIARLEAERDEAIREKKGIYRDLKEKERQLSEARNTVSSVPTHPSNEDPATFINDINTRGRQAIVDTVNPLIQVVMQQNAAAEARRSKERALHWLSKQESRRLGKIVDEEEIEENLVPEILKMADELGLKQTMDWENGAKATYKILEADRNRKKREATTEEITREERINRSSNEQVFGNVPTVETKVTGRVFTRSQVNEILNNIGLHPSDEQQKIMAELKLAEQQGRITIR